MTWANIINLPQHHSGLVLLHNEHKMYGESVREWTDDEDNEFKWRSEDAMNKAIDTDEVWALSWAVDAESGYAIAAPTLHELLDFAAQVGGETMQ